MISCSCLVWCSRLISRLHASSAPESLCAFAIMSARRARIASRLYWSWNPLTSVINFWMSLRFMVHSVLELRGGGRSRDLISLIGLAAIIARFTTSSGF